MRKSSFISTIIPAYNPRPFGYFFYHFPRKQYERNIPDPTGS
ncbi:Probable Fe-S oxidoreductase family 2 [Klebsiella pneumoniae ISC21]|nr:Probable Fe-S oxidoreductase family 2 [Klebsiella pneumoniae ISC21]